MTDHTEMQIPDDVMEAAIAVNGDIMFKGYDETVRVISMALVRERERCARIAIRQAPATQDFADAPLQQLATRIANKIRYVDK